jgi:predicted ATPase/class 3 adenylate cyclase
MNPQHIGGEAVAGMADGSTRTPPSGVVSFLFTDIEGSTRRWEADPEAMRSALVAHDDVLQRAVESHGGWLFKHTGDGVCAAFASPSAAVGAAIDAQRTLGLPVRMGIATGEAELRGDDYFGTVLNRTARLMSAGHGGQILLDGTTAGLVNGVELVSLGSRRLRDIAKPVDVFQIRAAGLRNEFPSLETDDRAPGNLRPPTTSFVGRSAELAELEAELESHRLVTLTGVGGVGKTRLALEVATRMADTFSDGVWVFELAAVGDPHAVPDAVAAVLGLAPQPGKSLVDVIAMALDGRSRLLLFDNCEHVLDAVANLIETILVHTESVTILATSREGLRLADEQLWPVPSLDVRAGTNSAAAALFFDRARAVAPGMSMTPADEANAVAEICQRLDGIPLAIELAASRMQSITAVEVRDRLDDRFRLLVGARRGLERHQTLRNTVQWSYDLLSADEKRLLTACSVFAGGFCLTAACRVAGLEDELATLDLLDALVRKSLLVADKGTGRTRFAMLETIRQFGEEQLAARGEVDAVRDAHAAFFAGMEGEIIALWKSPRQRAAYEWFTVELANLRIAFRWAADSGNIDAATAIAFCAAFLGTCVDQLEAVAWAEEMIEPAKAVGHRRLAQLYVAAVQCYQLGRAEDSVRYGQAAEEAIASGRFDPDPTLTEAVLGVGYIALGQPQRWVDVCRTVVAREPDANAFTYACLVNALTITGEQEQAVRESETMLTAAERTSNPLAQAHALLAYGFANTVANPSRAYRALKRGMTIAHDSGNRGAGTHMAVVLARLAQLQRDPLAAFDFVTIALRNFYDAGSLSLVPSPLAILAAILDELGHYEPAAIITGFAVNLLTPVAFPEVNAAIAHLREVLGDAPYESLAADGAAMSNATIANYAFEQIDLARAHLSQDAAPA